MGGMDGSDSKSWEQAHAKAHRQIALFETVIERIFRYIEMIAVIALLLVATGDDHPAAGATTAVAGSLLAGFYVALPWQRLLIDVAYRKRWGRSPRQGMWVGGALAGLIASLSYLVATALAGLIRTAMLAT